MKADDLKILSICSIFFASRFNIDQKIVAKILDRLSSFVARYDTWGLRKAATPNSHTSSDSRSKPSSYEVGEGAVPRDGTFLITYTHAAASRDDYKSSRAPPSKVITA